MAVLRLGEWGRCEMLAQWRQGGLGILSLASLYKPVLSSALYATVFGCRANSSGMPAAGMLWPEADNGATEPCRAASLPVAAAISDCEPYYRRIRPDPIPAGRLAVMAPR